MTDYCDLCFKCLAGNVDHEMPHRLVSPRGISESRRREIYANDIFPMVDKRRGDFEGIGAWI